jgi:hypothetical protein
VVAQALRRRTATGSGAPAPPVALPISFVESLVEPLFAEPKRARWAGELLGAPLALVCAEHCRAPAADLEPLRASAQFAAVRTKTARTRLIALCAAFANAGVPLVAFKGLASSLTLYQRPYQRLLPDADLLFHADDLPKLTHLLRIWGFATVTDTIETRRWGALTKASFAPVTPPDRAFLIDVHRDVDDAPASLGVTTKAVFAGAVTVDTEAGEVRVPAPEHALCILALHAFRDFYEPRGLKSLFDAALLLQKHGAAMKWDEVEQAARRGRFVKRMLFYRDLLAELGIAETGMPFADLKLSSLERRILLDVAENLRRLERFKASDPFKLLLELALFDSPIESARWNLARLRGLFATRSHALHGLPHV